MIILIVGIVVLGGVLGLFYLKDWLESPRLARMAYHELTARLAVVGAVLILVGLMLVAGDAVEWIKSNIG